MGSSSKPKRARQTKYEAELARQGVRAWNDFVADYIPVMQQTAEMSRVSEGERQHLAGNASAAAIQQTPTLSAIAANAPGGMSGGQAVARVSGASSNYTNMAAAQRNRGEEQLRTRELAGLSQAVTGGRGVQATGFNAMAQIGRAQTQQNIQSELNRQSWHQGLRSAAMSGVGMYGQHAGWFDEPTENPVEKPTRWQADFGDPHAIGANRPVWQ